MARPDAVHGKHDPLIMQMLPLEKEGELNGRDISRISLDDRDMLQAAILLNDDIANIEKNKRNLIWLAVFVVGLFLTAIAATAIAITLSSSLGLWPLLIAAFSLIPLTAACAGQHFTSPHEDLAIAARKRANACRNALSNSQFVTYVKEHHGAKITVDQLVQSDRDYRGKFGMLTMAEWLEIHYQAHRTLM